MRETARKVSSTKHVAKNKFLGYVGMPSVLTTCMVHAVSMHTACAKSFYK